MMIALQDVKEMGFLEKEHIRKGSFGGRFGMSLLNVVTMIDYQKCLISFVAVIRTH